MAPWSARSTTNSALNENDWLKQSDGTIGKASLPIFSLERTLGIDIENEKLGLEEVESVGGLISSEVSQA